MHRLKDVRQALGITQQQLASLLQHSRMAIAHVETGNRAVPRTIDKKLLTIEEVLTTYAPAETIQLPLTELQTKLLTKDRRVRRLKLSKLELLMETLEMQLAQTQRLQRAITALQLAGTTEEEVLPLAILLRLARQKQQQHLQRWCTLQVEQAALVAAIGKINALLLPGVDGFVPEATTGIPK